MLMRCSIGFALCFWIAMQGAAARVEAKSFPAASSPATAPALDPAFCQRLVTHRPAADVAYQAGVDVSGRAVVPADLEGESAFALPEEITIPLSAELSRFLKLDPEGLPAAALGRSEVRLGTLTLRGSRVYAGETPLSDAQAENLAVLCMKKTGP